MKVLPKLTLPDCQPDVREVNGKWQVRCLLRRRWIVLSPEEWVRQHMLHYLFQHLGFSRALSKVEFELHYHGLKKRADIVVFDNSGRPKIMVECKAPYVGLSQDTLLQLAVYNVQFMVPLLCVTNGFATYWYGLGTKGYAPKSHDQLSMELGI
ncbi:MAG: type I restriction enzyme HsdR N-terminal domain-containing protein [Bacteroidetes bacterium]|jgi:hypothetical protein|nr:type I restriction enzyme HsdR N-terminal domain-containing protein [Bacteroidota bacterium]